LGAGRAIKPSPKLRDQSAGGAGGGQNNELAAVQQIEAARPFHQRIPELAIQDGGQLRANRRAGRRGLVNHLDHRGLAGGLNPLQEVQDHHTPP
jgi:hypothetical protein